jgi:hypothetical protein
MKLLPIFNREPHDGTDVTWNRLRLAGKLLGSWQDARVFFPMTPLNWACDVCRPPENQIRTLISGTVYQIRRPHGSSTPPQEFEFSRLSPNFQPTHIAAEVKKGDKVLTLRDANGFPAWSGRRCR